MKTSNLREVLREVNEKIDRGQAELSINTASALDDVIFPIAKAVQQRGVIPAGTYVYPTAHWDIANREGVKDRLNQYFYPLKTECEWTVDRGNATYYPDGSAYTPHWLFVHLFNVPGIYGFVVSIENVIWQ